jgi:hypothetical protein
MILYHTPKKRVEASAEMFEPLETEPDFLSRVITDDESWFVEYDPETKKPLSSSQEIARMSKPIYRFSRGSS